MSKWVLIAVFEDEDEADRAAEAAMRDAAWSVTQEVSEPETATIALLREEGKYVEEWSVVHEDDEEDTLNPFDHPTESDPEEGE